MIALLPYRLIDSDTQSHSFTDGCRATARQRSACGAWERPHDPNKQ
jgi:hypothetical protein